ncbi:alanine--glyoxylate aminotransferase family protein [soil metagenome]
MAQLEFTLAAGPVAVSHRTLAGLARPVVYHYDPDFIATFKRVEEKTAQIFRTSNDIVLMQGEAIVGLEGAARSVVQHGTPVLNLVQGVFGKGMGYWLTSFGAVLHEIEVPYNDAVTPDQVRAYLDEHPEIEVLTLVASETPSGTVCDVEAIGRLCRDRGVLTVIDTVSGVLGMPWETDAWGLDIVIAGAQKCLGGPPGIAMLAVSAKAWERIESNPSAPRDSYLSLLDWKTKWHGEGRFPYTPSVSDVQGLEAALDQALEEGIDNVVRRHQLAAEVTRAGATAMGLELWPVRTEIASACVTSVRLPDGVDNLLVRNLVRERYGVMLSHGQGAGNLIRIAHMGPTATGLHQIVGLSALGRLLADLGQPVTIGAGLEAALAVLSSQRS